MFVTSISIYPIKATAAIDLPEAEVRRRGLADDRRWVLADEDGQFLHQRIHAKLAAVQSSLASDGSLHVDAPGRSPLRIARPDGSERFAVTVWRDTVDAALAASDAQVWFSEYMGFPCRLLFMDTAATRPVAPEYGRPGDVVSFADAIPLLLTTEASLGDLNARLSDALPMARFRPNVVIDGDNAWEEEHWERLRIGAVEFEVTHPCVRCVVTTIDQRSGQRSGDGEPLKTLASFRKTADGVCFGVNILPRGVGQIHVGDSVEVIS